MNLWEPIDLYCERTSATFWAEPVNAITNIAFLVAAGLAFVRWRKAGGNDAWVLALIAVVVLVGLGSFAFHTLATRGAMLLDVGPIGLFIYGYLALALRRYLGLSAIVTLSVLIAFIVLTQGLVATVPRAILNGAVGYLPALAALIVIAAMTASATVRNGLLLAALLFVISLTVRVVDLDICPTLPLGTHFAWHLFNAAVLYSLLHTAISFRHGANPA